MAFRFKKFEVYKDAKNFSRFCREIVNEQIADRNLADQIKRALNSIVLNIAEGSDRGTDKDFAHFLNNAHASLNEVVACIDVALDNKYISNKEHEIYLDKLMILANQLTAFRNKLLKNPNK